MSPFLFALNEVSWPPTPKSKLHCPPTWTNRWAVSLSHTTIPNNIKLFSKLSFSHINLSALVIFKEILTLPFHKRKSETIYSTYAYYPFDRAIVLPLCSSMIFHTTFWQLNTLTCMLFSGVLLHLSTWKITLKMMMIYFLVIVRTHSSGELYAAWSHVSNLLYMSFIFGQIFYSNNK